MVRVVVVEGIESCIVVGDMIVIEGEESGTVPEGYRTVELDDDSEFSESGGVIAPPAPPAPAAPAAAAPAAPAAPLLPLLLPPPLLPPPPGAMTCIVNTMETKRMARRGFR